MGVLITPNNIYNCNSIPRYALTLLSYLTIYSVMPSHVWETYMTHGTVKMSVSLTPKRVWKK